MNRLQKFEHLKVSFRNHLIREIILRFIMDFPPWGSVPS